MEDAAEGIALAPEKHNEVDPINLRAGFEISIKDLAKLICELTDIDGKIEWDTFMPIGQPRQCLDTSKAKKKFGFEANTPFEEGLRRTTRWYEEHVYRNE